MKNIFIFSFLFFSSQAFAMLFDFYSSPSKFPTQTFATQREFDDFYRDREEIRNIVHWQGIQPRSYVFAIDFTYSAANGFKVLELSKSPSDASGTTSFPFAINLPFVLNFGFKRFFDEASSSGSDGHTKIYGTQIDSLILNSARHFLENTNIPLVDISSFSSFKREYVEHFTNSSTTPIAFYPSPSSWATLDWDIFDEKSLAIDHIAHHAVTETKTASFLLPQISPYSIETELFDAKTVQLNIPRLMDFMKRTGMGEFILKPVDLARSEGVRLVKRENFEDPTFLKQLASFLKASRFWMLQSYFPNYLVQNKQGAFESPTGRIFYQVIYDGSRLGIMPLTVYQKFNGHTYERVNDLYDGFKTGFGALQEAGEYSRAELEIIIASANDYVSKVAGSLFHLAQKGLSGDGLVAEGLRARWNSFSVEQKQVIRESVRYNLYNFIGSDETFKGYQVFENPIPPSLKAIEQTASTDCKFIFTQKGLKK